MIQPECIPSVAVRTEHHAVVLGDVDDAVLGLDGHPAQLDVLRVGRADTRVLLDTGHRGGMVRKRIVAEHVNSTGVCVCPVPSGSRPAAR